MKMKDCENMTEEELREELIKIREERSNVWPDKRLLWQLGYRVKHSKKTQERKLFIKDKLKQVLKLQQERLSVDKVAKRLRRKPRYIQLILKNQQRIMTW